MANPSETVGQQSARPESSTRNNSLFLFTSPRSNSTHHYTRSYNSFNMDTSRQSDLGDELALFRNIKKLRTYKDYRRWRREFLSALEILGGIYPAVLREEVDAPKEPEYENNEEEFVINSIYMDMMRGDDMDDFEANKAKYIITGDMLDAGVEKIDTGNQNLRKKYVNDLAWYEIAHARILMFMSYSIGEHAGRMIASCYHPRDAYDSLARIYGYTSPQTNIDMMGNFMKIQYKGKDAAAFNHRFQEALRDLEEAMGKMPLWYVHTIYMNSVRVHPRSQTFVQNFKVREMTEETIRHMYRDFVLSISIKNWTFQD